MNGVDPRTFDLLRLTLVPGLGPVLINRLLAAFGSPDAVLRSNGPALAAIRGLGADRARSIAAWFGDSESAAKEELHEAARVGARVVSAYEAEYPALLRQIPDPPPVIYVRGALRPENDDRYPVAIVGSRSCSQYGREQADRFAAALAESGLTVVSGGARGIDTAAHRAALRTKGRTFAVLGCGLSNNYPPDNAELFSQIAAAGEHGAVISELPMRTSPSAENFPARNRIISGLSLGVIVIEAGRRSGALITARAANEDHGREVFALPGRVDAPSSEGTLDLIKQGAAGLITCPQDVIDALESRARHQFQGSHEAITSNPTREPGFVFDRPVAAAPPAPVLLIPDPSLSETQRAIVGALAEPGTLDDVIRATGLDAGKLMAELTVLEIRKLVVRSGAKLSLRRATA